MAAKKVSLLTWVLLITLALFFGGFFVRKTIGYADRRKRAKALAIQYTRSAVEALKVFTLFQTENAQFDPAADASDGKSYGLGQITPFWVNALLDESVIDPIAWLKNADNNARLTVKIIRYFESRNYSFPTQADIYNVGETLWRKGVRNAEYQRRYLGIGITTGGSF
jgi:hypothetical protein